MIDPDVRAPLTALPWLSRLARGALAACEVCRCSTVWRLPASAPAGRDVGLHPGCVTAAMAAGLLGADGEDVTAPQIPTGPRRGAYAKHWQAA